MSAKRILIAGIMSVLLAAPGIAQTAQGPAELPPADFSGREYVDSRGCVFLRSTFGGQVTWVPRFGPDRQPICTGQTTTAPAAAPAPEPATPPAPSVETAAPSPAPAPPAPAPAPVRVTSAPVAAPAPARVAAAAAPARTERRTRAAPQRRAAPAQALHPRGPDADGRHPDCPLNAQYGRLVRTTEGRILVMCVMSPELFPENVLAGTTGLVEVPPTQTIRAAPVPGRGSVLQVGSFRVPDNANRLSGHLRAQGFNVHLHRQGAFTVVTVGPFADGVQAHSALQAVRRAGIRDAYFR